MQINVGKCTIDRRIMNEEYLTHLHVESFVNTSLKADVTINRCLQKILVESSEAYGAGN